MHTLHTLRCATLYQARTDKVFKQSPTVSGVGITMEGIDQNPAYYTYVLDRGWKDETTTTMTTAAAAGSTTAGSTSDTTTWLQQWGLSRCGLASAGKVSE